VSGAGVTKGGNKQERTAEEEQGKEMERAKDGASSSKRGDCGRGEEEDARARGGSAAAP